MTTTSTSPLPVSAKVLPAQGQKFSDPDWTAKGEQRAKVGLDHLDTLWINTGSLCNITCRNCYIDSSPLNDKLAYVTAAEVQPFLEEALALGTREIGFTGGEPFMNPDFLDMLGTALDMGFEALVLTNAMQPMQRPRITAPMGCIRSSAACRDPVRFSRTSIRSPEAGGRQRKRMVLFLCAPMRMATCRTFPSRCRRRSIHFS